MKGRRKVFDGIAVSSGIVVGPAVLYDTRHLLAPRYAIAASEVPREIARLREATGKAADDLQEELNGAPPEAAKLLGAYHRALLSPRLVKSLSDYIDDHLVNAEQAVGAVVDDLSGKLSDTDDLYLSDRADDIRGLGLKIIEHLAGGAPWKIDIPPDAVVLADQIPTAEAVKILPNAAHVFASETGGVQGHTALLARSWGVPGVIGIRKLLDAARPGETVIVDGGDGRVIINPRRTEIEFYLQKKADLEAARQASAELAKRPAVTKDKVRIGVYHNISLTSGIPDDFDVTGDGIGLLRTEYLFLNNIRLSEDAQYLALRAVVRRMKGKSVTVRLADIGADKTTRTALKAGLGTMGGLRGVRWLLSNESFFRRHSAAVLRAAKLGPVKILLPMVTDADDVESARRVMKEVLEAQRAKGRDVPRRLPPIGAMVETPAAVLKARELSKHAAFLSLGTNDLVQYALAVDRNDPEMAKFYTALDPAVLRLMAMTVEAAGAAGIPLTLCGGIAADPKFTKLLLGIGIKDLSMTAAAMPGLKERISRIDMKDAKAFARRMLAAETLAAAKSLFDKEVT